MKRVVIVEYEEIFNFAMQRSHDILWNACVKMFFKKHILSYKSYNRIEKSQIQHKYNDLKYNEDESAVLAYTIILDFMTYNKINKMIVLN